MRIKKGDTVYVRTGAAKGKTGRVLNVNEVKGKILVEGVNMRKKHQRPTQKNPKGGIITIEAPIDISNVALYSSSAGGPVKIGTRVIDDDGRKKKVRINRDTGEEI